MLKKEQLTILDIDQIKNLNVLKNNLSYTLTDFALLTGAAVSSRSSQGYCWTKNHSLGTGRVMVISSSGQISSKDAFSRHGVIRPIILPGEITQTILANEEEKDGIISFGYYPQDVVSSSFAEKLEKLFVSNQLKSTNHFYTIDARPFDDEESSFVPCRLMEYEYQGRKFIRVKSNYASNNVTLSDQQKHKNHFFEWVEVSPVTWIVDHESGALIAEKGLLSGISFHSEKDYQGDFSNTNLQSFFDQFLFDNLFEKTPYEKEETIKEYVPLQKPSIEDFSSYQKFRQTSSKELKNVLNSVINIYYLLEPLSMYSSTKSDGTPILWNDAMKISFSFLYVGLQKDPDLKDLFEQYQIHLKDLFIPVHCDNKLLLQGSKDPITPDLRKDIYDRAFKPYLMNFQKALLSIYNQYTDVPYCLITPILLCYSFSHLSMKPLFRDLLIAKGIMKENDKLEEVAFFKDMRNRVVSEEISSIIQGIIPSNIETITTIPPKRPAVTTESSSSTNPRRPTLKHRGNDIFLKYGHFLGDKEYLTNPAVGRENELQSLMLGLLTQEKSVALVGPPGVGKTALVEGLAYLITRGEVPKALRDYDILKVNTSSLISGTIYRGQFEERVEKLLHEIERDHHVILFIDELHTVIGSGKGEQSSLDFANLLKPYLDRGQVKIIGATTLDEYERYIEQDTALKRRFKKVKVKEPTDEVMLQILDSSLERLSKKTKIEVAFNEEEKDLLFTTLLRVTEKARRVYDDPLYNPDLALSIVDTAFAYATLKNASQVEMEHFAEAIRLEERIYESTRKGLAQFLIDQYTELKGSCEMENIPSTEEKPKCKVISFAFLFPKKPE